MRILFFDTETTGFKTSTHTPRLVQIGAILQDSETGRILSEFNGMVVTEDFPIPEEASNIHGITNELADANGFPMDAVDKIFAGMISCADLVVAHNIQFDLGIVEDNLPISAGFISTKEHFCTMINSTEIVGILKSHGGGNKWPKLTEAYRHFFEADFDNAHDAMADVRACRDIYFKLLHQLQLKIV